MAALLGELTRVMERELTDLSFASGENFSAVAAIDFGTTFSGYAFSYTAAPEDIKTNMEWGTEVGVTRYKTPTCVLTDGRDQLVAFGYEALNKYAEDLEGSTEYHLYDRFKMNLYKEKIIGSKTVIASRGGRLRLAEYIISLGLKYLYNHIVETLQKSNQRKINKKQIRWVLTVPAIWSESAKQLMRRAAFKAGIINSLGSKRLVIALEPEAASFWCRQLTLDKFNCDIQTGEKLTMVSGTKYIVVDCGGGTIDVTVHQIANNNNVKEVYTASGGAWGGITVDNAFIALIEKLFGAELINKFRKENPQDWLGMILQFETKKRSFDPTSSKTMNISLSFNFGTAVYQYKSEPVDIVVQKAQIDGVGFKQGYLVFQMNVIQQLYMPSISNIIQHVQGVLQKPHLLDTEYLYLVGGYSDCKFLQQKVQAFFSKRIKVMIPQDAGMAIIRGAVLFGHYPESVISRIARKTYGECVMNRFNENDHDPEKKITVDGLEYCDHIFKKWVKKNESIETGVSRTFVGYPHSSESTKANLKIYSSDKEADAIVYVTDPGVEKIGHLSIQIPDKHLAQKERKITTHVFFGGTEIYVRLEDGARGADGDFAETNIDFLAE